MQRHPLGQSEPSYLFPPSLLATKLMTMVKSQHNYCRQTHPDKGINQLYLKVPSEFDQHLLAGAKHM